MKKRCDWVGELPIYLEYHDTEWGRPNHNGPELFEKFVLDSFQAGLSWITVLRKREHFRNAFDQFDAKKIAAYDQQKIDELLNNAGIIRNRLKIEATIGNAKAYLSIVEEEGDFGKYLWSFVGGKPIINRWKSKQEVPAHSVTSDAMSKALKSKGFKFCGSTICYAFMQAVGMINDHTIDCFCYNEING
jgi:DNA-3-methyladenine glycosylase I